MPLTKTQQLRHLYGRATFGATPAELTEAAESGVARQPLAQTVRRLFDRSAAFEPLTTVDATSFVNKGALKALFANGQLGREMLRQRIQANNQLQRDLNLQWLDRMVGQNTLHEKMALFWHGHFACRVNNPVAMQQYVNVLRQYALAPFGELLTAVSKTPAMLQFLNNQQNRKGAPNENFAREVMELFTLGREGGSKGNKKNYTEQDIKEAARAFTGWQFTAEGEFVFRPRFHDEGEKEIFGQRGFFTGDDVLKLLLARPETAQFITRKLYRFFVNDEHVDERRVTDLSRPFFREKYDVAALLERMFTADWFYEPKNVGAHIKSPVELLATMRHQTGATFSQPQPQLFIQRTLGQLLLYPPNVAGWPGGRNWIDSSSLLFRMNLPGYVFAGANVAVQPKDEADVNAQALARKGGNQFSVTVDWNAFAQPFANVADAALPDAVAACLLPWPLTAEQRNVVTGNLNTTSRPERVRALTLAMMRLPEYQLT